MNKYKSDYITIEEELTKQRKRLEKYPKGTLRRRTIKGGEYHYLQYRDGKHVRSRYVHADDVADLLDMIEERRELEKKSGKCSHDWNTMLAFLEYTDRIVRLRM